VLGKLETEIPKDLFEKIIYSALFVVIVVFTGAFETFFFLNYPRKISNIFYCLPIYRGYNFPVLIP